MNEVRPVNGVVKSSRVKDNIKDYVMVILATLIYAVSTYRYVLDSDFAPSGLSGILAMVQHVTDLNKGTFTLLFINIPLLILGFFMLSKNFALKTTISVFILCGTLFLLELIDPEHKFRYNVHTEMEVAYIDNVQYFITREKDSGFLLYNGVKHYVQLLDNSQRYVEIEGVKYFLQTITTTNMNFGRRFFCSIIGGVFAGIAIAMTFKANASLGGTDILVMIIQNKRPHANVSLLLTGFNLIVIVASIFVYRNIESICFALIYIVIFSKVTEYIMNGVKKATKIEVITEHPEELSKEIIERLGHSVTVTNVRGMYANTNKYMLVCVIRPRQVAEFEKILKEYPDSFSFSSSVSEVFGVFFRN